MLKRSELVSKVNEQLWEGLYSYTDMEEEFDEAIDEINAELSANFPSFGDVMTEDDSTYSRDVTVDETTIDTPYFPEKYLRNIVVPFVVSAIFRREAEFGNEYYTAKEKYEKWISNMFRDYFTQVPEEFQNVESGFINVERNAMDVDVDDDETILPAINPLDQ